jgi:hypothetical protein
VDQRILRYAVVGAAVALFLAYQAISNRDPAASGAESSAKLTPEVQARGLTFAPGVAPGDQEWVQAAIAQARPEAQQLIGAIDGLVTIGTVNEPDAPYVGMADPESNDIVLNVAFLDGKRVADRETTVLHELGHIVDFALVPDDRMRALAAQIPSGGGCITAERGDCTVPEERFADTFAKWALRGAVSGVGAGYGVMSPSSLEDWGAPLGLIAAQLSIGK